MGVYITGTKQNKKLQKNLGHFFSWNDRNECNKGSFNENTVHYGTRVTMVSGKNSKKIGDNFSHGTIGTNVTKGVSMIIKACLYQHYGTRVTMVTGRCKNHWNETERKTPKKSGTFFSHGTIGTYVTKGVSNDIKGLSVSALWNKSNNGFLWCINHWNTVRPVLSLKLPLLHFFRSFLEKKCPQFLFFVLFLSSDLHIHQNPSLLLFHSDGHRWACIIIETPFVTFVPIIP